MDMHEDQFDFHQYCVRRFTINIYLKYACPKGVDFRHLLLLVLFNGTKSFGGILFTSEPSSMLLRYFEYLLPISDLTVGRYTFGCMIPLD